MRILVLNGPNLGTIGRRQPEIYGNVSLAEIHDRLRREAQALGIDLRWELSNHEGALIDLIEEETDVADAIVINPGGLAHTSVVLADALRAFGRPVVEVHLSNILSREEYRRTSHVAAAAAAVITGAGADGYVMGLQVAARLAAESTTETEA
ncbi:MAG TPA: type II 3-dehydroquinate dehydratase [Candidatus Deferrimicrobium sp.]|nr:type II 3-dehydroquinate dehydratase [Candidatus Deferrimicrobium sp.]